MARVTISKDFTLRWRDQVELFDETVLCWLSFGQRSIDITHYNSVLRHPKLSPSVCGLVNRWEESKGAQKFVQTILSGMYKDILPPPPPHTSRILAATRSHTHKLRHPTTALLSNYIRQVDREWIPDNAQPDTSSSDDDEEDSENNSLSVPPAKKCKLNPGLPRRVVQKKSTPLCKDKAAKVGASHLNYSSYRENETTAPVAVNT